MSQPCILVAGGAGYIGAHFCKTAARAGFRAVVLDRLTASSARVENYRRESMRGLPLEIADIGDAEAVRAVLNRHKPVAAVCFAALIEVAESVAKPDLYWENNFIKAARFFETLQDAGVNKLIFSSTAAVYGTPQRVEPLREDSILHPINPYGETKLGCEVMLQNPPTSAVFAETLKKRAGTVKHFPQLNSVIFRYFNAAGGDENLGEMHEPETHLIPNALLAAGNLRGKTDFTLFGDDYPTKDGSAIRDYIHVKDLAEAHVLGLNYLLKDGPSDIFNLGTRSGHSVKEVVDMARKVTGKDFPVKVGPRRAGDPPFLVANAAKAAARLNWKPKHTLHSIVESAWAFHQKHG